MRLVAAFVLVALASAPAAARAAGGVLTLQIENDRAAATDRHYTQGGRLSYLSGEEAFPAWLTGLGNALNWGRLFAFGQGGKTVQRRGYAIGQSIFTPEDVRDTALVAGDRPYAGWLYAGFSAHTEHRITTPANPRGDPVRLDTVELDLGVVGPAAFGAEVQNNFHDLINSTRSQGWDNQLDNEPGVVLAVERRWRLPIHPLRGGRIRTNNVLGMDVLPHMGGSLGNVMTYAAVGATVRFGMDLFKDFGPPRIRPSLSGSHAFDVKRGFGWYLFAGGEGRLVARNIFLDGNTSGDGHSVDKKPLVGDAQIGIAIVFPGARLTYTHVFRTREFRGQRRADRFGAFSLSVRF
ncbi:MAG: lipid A deacylase LpxR family protein [Alphaproteobacteria bacterium]